MGALRRLWAHRHRRPRFVAASLGVLAFLLAYPAVQWWLGSIDVAGRFAFYDLGAYRIAVRSWEAGEPLYRRNEGGGYHGSYLYPPVYVLLFWPFAQLPFRAAGFLWNGLSVLTLWLGLQAAIAAYRLRLARYERALLLWAIVGFHPVILSMRLAQVSVFLAGLLSFALAGLVYAERGSDAVGAGSSGSRDPGRTSRAARYLSGVATALGGTVKLIFAPAGAHLLQDRRRFAAAALTGLALLAVSLAVFGVEAHRTYLDVLTWGKGWGTGSRHPRYWQAPYFRPMYVLGGAAGLAVRSLLVVAVGALAVLSAGRGVDAETFALGVASIPLVAPRAYTQDFALFLPVVVVLLAAELPRTDGRPVVPLVGLLLAAIHSFGLYAVVDVLPGLLPGGGLLLALAPVLQPGLWASVLLVGLAGWRVAEAATLPAHGVRRPDRSHR